MQTDRLGQRTFTMDEAAADEADDEEDLDVEMALLALTEDMGGPTEDVDLSALSPTEKRALLVCLQAQLGLAGKIQDN